MSSSNYNKKKICFVTGSRSEYGLLKNLINSLSKDRKISTKLIVTGSHLLKQYGNTSNEILKDKNKIFKKIKITFKNNYPSDLAKSTSQIIDGLSNIFKNYHPDLLVVLGDRYEIFITCYVATIFKIPIAHICGGEETLKSYDNQFRHAITKMSHIHFTTHATYKKKILDMGENKKNVFNFGSLAFSNLKHEKFKNKLQLEKKYKIKFGTENFLVTIHPETIDNKKTNKNLKKIFKSLSNKKFEKFSFFFTSSNNDEGGGKINNKIKKFVNDKKNLYFVNSFGQTDYFSMLKNISGVIGNSSSGIIEVPTFKIGTINLGDRQKGRIFARSVINCDFQTNEIKKNILKIINKRFKIKLKNLVNPYHKNNTLENIKRILIKINLKNILFKSFRGSK